MKANPFMMACTFLLGAMVVLMATMLFQRPASAAGSPSGDGNAPITAITVSVGSSKEYLVVFKEVENVLPTAAADDMKKVTAMAVYDFQANGSGKGQMYLIASRYIEWDLRLYDLPQSRDAGRVGDIRKAFEEIKKQGEPKTK
jgi:hypothetical protein